MNELPWNTTTTPLTDGKTIKEFLETLRRWHQIERLLPPLVDGLVMVMNELERRAEEEQEQAWEDSEK